MRFRSAILGTLLALVTMSCAASTPTAQGWAEPPNGAESAPAHGDTLKLRLYNAYTQAPDPRFTEMPRKVKVAELTPQVTVQLETELPAASVLFELDGQRRLDSTAPFLLTEGKDGRASHWELTPGPHQLQITVYSGPEGRGWVLAKTSRAIEVVQDGMDATPQMGEHTPYLFWLTSDGRYVTRTSIGDFADLRGEVVLSKDQIKLVEPEEEQGRLMTVTGAAPSLDFAFQVLLPDGYNPAVHYPLVVHLHHGWHVFRGTDNDGRMLKEEPIFSGEQSLTRSQNRVRYPAIFLVPQMVKKETRDGVEQEWGAFTDLDNTAGNVKSAAEPSVSGAYAIKALNDLLHGALPVAGSQLGVDPARLYIIGHSMGGLGTWDFLQRWPRLFAAGVPMAGYPDHSRAALVKDIPIWAFHHRLDCYNPVVGTRTMQRLVVAASGTQMRYTELSFDTGGKCDQAHFQTPTEAWNDPELPLWLFSQVGAGH